MVNHKDTIGHYFALILAKGKIQTGINQNFRDQFQKKLRKGRRQHFRWYQEEKAKTKGDTFLNIFLKSDS